MIPIEKSLTAQFVQDAINAGPINRKRIVDTIQQQKRQSPSGVPGWDWSDAQPYYNHMALELIFKDVDTFDPISVADALLDPRAWQAVGRERGWENEVTVEDGITTIIPGWRVRWIRFYTLRADGQSVDAALAHI